MEWMSEAAKKARNAFTEARMDAERRVNEIFLQAMEVHFDGDPMDHVSECSLQIQPGYREPRMDAPSITYHRLIRNSDHKILAECKIILGRYEIRVEGEVFK